MDQPKIERMLRLMKMMSGPVNYSVSQLADRLEMSERTIYRYVDTFKNAGYCVRKISPTTYKLATISEDFPDFERLVYFSEEESYLVNSLIDALVPTNSLKKGLKSKLAAIYDSTSIADYVDRRSNAAHVENLSRASKEKKKAVLRAYESGHSHTVRDRIVEPYAFTTDYIDICAFDLEDKRNKTFKISRIGQVDVLDEGWTSETLHRQQGMDIFRMSGESIGHIRWQMTVMAKNLLIEEFPLAERALSRDGADWILDATLCDFAGACRFFVGLASEIKIIDSPQFVAYVNEYLKDIKLI